MHQPVHRGVQARNRLAELQFRAVWSSAVVCSVLPPATIETAGQAGCLCNRPSACQGLLLTDLLSGAGLGLDDLPQARRSPYFEALYLVARTKARWIDRPGNVLCLCATCCVKLQHGPVEAEDLMEQVLNWRPEAEGGDEPANLCMSVCGEGVVVPFRSHAQAVVRVVVDRGRQIYFAILSGSV